MEQRINYDLSIEDAVTAIKQINSSRTMLASDALIAEHFNGIKGSLATVTIAERVVLLDGLWGTRLFMESGASDRIVGSLMANSGLIQDELRQLKVDTLEQHPGVVYAIAEKVFPFILIQSEEGEKFRQNYSFATKFFHWVTRSHFPIADSRARKKINQIQRTQGVRPRVRSSTAAMNGLTYIREYERWVHFYSDLLVSLGDKGKEVLKQADWDSQPQDYRKKNSLLRILDKVFYGQGGGSGQGRVTE